MGFVKRLRCWLRGHRDRVFLEGVGKTGDWTTAVRCDRCDRMDHYFRPASKEPDGPYWSPAAEEAVP